VKAGWEFAIESVLGELLEAVSVDDSMALLNQLGDMNQGHLSLVEGRKSDVSFPTGSLAEKVEGPDVLRTYLGQVYTAADLASAKEFLAKLSEHDSVITPAGEWLSRGFVRVLRSGQAQQGALQRETEVKSLRSETQSLVIQEQQVVADLAALKDELAKAEFEREEAQRSMYHAHRSVSELSGQIQGIQDKLQSAQERISVIESDLAQAAQSLEESQLQVREARIRLQQATESMADFELQRSELENQRILLNQHREKARAEQIEHANASHQAALATQSHQTAVAALRHSIARLIQQRDQIQAQSAELDEQLKHGDNPIERLSSERQTVLDLRVVFDDCFLLRKEGVVGFQGHVTRFTIR